MCNKIRFTKYQAEELDYKISIRIETLEDDPDSAGEGETLQALKGLQLKLRLGVIIKLNEWERKFCIEEFENAADIAKSNWDNGDQSEGGRYRSILGAIKKLYR